MQTEHGVEFAAMLDARTGASLAPYLRGTATSVITEPHLRSMVPGREYVQVHSHPTATTFSIDDIAILFDYYPSIRSTVVVAAEGWWYVMSAKPGADHYPMRTVYQAYRRAWEHLELGFLVAIDEGRTIENAAALNLHRAIWRTIAGDLSFLYHEVEADIK